MTFEEIVAILGRPQRDTGSGIWIMEWDMKSGKAFAVCFNKAASDPYQPGFDLYSFHMEVRDK